MRVIWQRLGMNLSFREIACGLNISVVSVINKFEQTGTACGSQESKEQTRVQQNLMVMHHQLNIIGLVFENPSIHLGELCSEIKAVTGVEIIPSTV